MTKYCPTCHCEYQDIIQICPDDQSQLTSKQTDEILGLVMVNVYAAANEIEAERIVAFLEANEIKATHTQTNISQLPTTNEIHFIITVATSDKEKARSFLSLARQDGIITVSGIFL